MPNVTLNTPIVKLDKNIIGKSVKELEEKYRVKLKSVNKRKSNSKHKLRAGDQIEIYGSGKDVYGLFLGRFVK